LRDMAPEVPAVTIDAPTRVVNDIREQSTHHSPMKS
jgi:hypothetical protein